jgi:hypothetical protein
MSTASHPMPRHPADPGSMHRGLPGAVVRRRGTVAGCVGWFCAGLILLAECGWNQARASALDTPIVLTQIPADARGAAPADWRADGVSRADGWEGARVVMLTGAGTMRVVSAAFHSACDPEVSPDGTTLLFAAKPEPASSWGIWEMNIETGSVREVIRDRWDCRGPRYLGSLFTLDSPEPWFTILITRTDGTMNEWGHGAATSLYSVKRDGSELRRLTFEPSASFDPIQMMDGRVVYAVWRYPMAGFASPGRVSLMAVNIDGTDQLLYGGQQGRRIQQMLCATECGQVVFVESDEATWDGAGQLACLREERPLHSYRSLTCDDHNVWLYPAPMEPGFILVSRRAALPGAQSGVYRFDLTTGQAERVFDDPDYHNVQARLVATRPVPDGRSTVVNPKVSTGVFYGMNAYLTEADRQPHWTPGLIHRLRVIEGMPAAAEPTTASCPPNGSVMGRRLLGEAVVEPDGSFHFEVPADLPVQLQALDREGLALATCGWIWVKQKENRGCIGCHEDGELTPDNRFVTALARPPNRLTLPPDKRRAVGFKEQIFPVLQARCANAHCHGHSQSILPVPTAGEDVDAGVVWQLYTALLEHENGRGKYVDPGRARTSPLVWNLYGQDRQRPWDATVPSSEARGWTVQKMPPERATPLTALELRLWVEWIDLGAQWDVPRSGSTEINLAVDHEQQTQ